MSDRTQPAAQQWFWDPNRRERYRIDERAQEIVYESGERIPRSLPRSSQSGTSSQRSDHRSYSQGSQDNAYTHRYSGSTGSGAYPIPAGYPAAGVPPTTTPASNLVPNLAAMSIAPQSPLSSQQGQRWAQPRTPNELLRRTVRDHNGVQIVTVIDPGTQVQSTWAAGPRERFTDPYLASLGGRAEYMLVESPGEEERLFPSYRLRRPASQFFVVGRVFMVLWVEPAGETTTTFDSTCDYEPNEIIPGRYAGERVFSKVRRFVVIRATQGAPSCTALPIVSYGRQGVGKRGVVKAEHAIIHTTDQAPPKMPEEEPARGELPMRPQSIRVVPDERTNQLDPRSRLDFGKVYTIHHNNKAKPIGMVHPNSMNALESQFWNVFRNAQSRPGAPILPQEASSAGSGRGPSRTSRSTGRSSHGHPTGPIVQDNEEDESSSDDVDDSDGEDAPGEDAQDQAARAARLAQHRQSINTFNLYNQLMNREPRHSHAESIQYMVTALMNAQPSINSREEATRHILERIQYARSHLQRQSERPSGSS